MKKMAGKLVLKNLALVDQQKLQLLSEREAVAASLVCASR